MDEFVTLQNLKHCEGRFRSYMDSHHGIRFSGESDDGQLRQLLYTTMVEVRKRESGAGASGGQPPALKALNNATLNAARDTLLQQPAQPRLPGASSAAAGDAQSSILLSREREVYGERQVYFNEMLPATSDRRSDVTGRIVASHDRAVGERSGGGGGRGGGAPAMQLQQTSAASERAGESVGAMAAEEFERRLAELARGRDADFGAPQPDDAFVALAELSLARPAPAMSMPRTAGADEPEASQACAPLMSMSRAKAKAKAKAAGGGGGGGGGGDGEDEGGAQFAQSHPQDSLEIARRVRRDADAWVESQAPGSAAHVPYENRFQSADLLIPSPAADQVKVIERYLTIDGSDRDYLSEPLRYRFTARTAGLQTSSSLMRNYHNIVWLEATRVLLPMEIVSATGSVIMPKGYYNIEYSFAFQYLVLLLDDFDGLMDGTNELLRRAFCVFVYDQDYKAPNGRGYVMLKPAQGERKTFHTPVGSLRDLNISLVRPNGVLFNSSQDDMATSYLQYETQNPLMIKVVVDQYFDRNDFWPGDMVRITGMAIAPLAQPPDAAGLTALLAYLNRGEGHEVIQLGSTNAQGFINSFYVLAPAQLDTANGVVVVDTASIAAVASLGAGAGDATATSRVTSPGRLMNMSLQAVLTMKLGCIEAVPGVLHPNQVAGAASGKVGGAAVGHNTLQSRPHAAAVPAEPPAAQPAASYRRK